MRNTLANTLMGYVGRTDFVFVTGDLGYRVLEPLRQCLGQRFINAGVAEQNMVSMAAGLAQTGLRPWLYSIAPFLYGRPFEQIRNDLCLHNLPVCLVGNGGGYSYGVMGATHHALEDYGVLLCLRNMHVFVPVFAQDVPEIVKKLFDFPHPMYVRLGYCEKPRHYDPPSYAPWRRLLKGDGGATMLIMGPIAGGILQALMEAQIRQRPDIWILTELPISPESIPAGFMNDLHESDHLIVVEEHIAQGGMGQILARCLLEMGQPPARFTHRTAQGYPSGLYGSQTFHRKESKLGPEQIIMELCHGSKVKN